MQFWAIDKSIKSTNYPAYNGDPACTESHENIQISVDGNTADLFSVHRKYISVY